ncbi:hypothetical protein AB0M45_03795 [Nocardia sp. NPDC051787]|uniref:hypothetical protein n=1 Tax=Nocardia sp. NPDC051787 TaxID=3155415 RepID=UPI0034223DE2
MKSRMRLYLLALNPTDSVSEGFLPAAAALGMDATILTDQPDVAALDRGVHRIHVESVTELRMLADLAASRGAAAPVGVLLRVNLPLEYRALADSALAMGGRPTPFGLDPREADALAADLAHGRYPGLRWYGVRAHLASGLDATDLVTVAESIVRWSMALARRHGVELAEVNVGGGMNVDYTAPGTRFDWESYGHGLARIAEAWPRLRLRIEPGLALTAYCGWYVTEVLDVKHSHGTEFVIIRGGTHHLRTPAAKAHDQPCVVLPDDSWPHPWPRAAAIRPTATITGQLCTPKDVLASRVPVAGVRTGDRLAFGLAGAYAWNISHHDFLMHPAPGFHYVDDITHQKGAD